MAIWPQWLPILTADQALLPHLWPNPGEAVIADCRNSIYVWETSAYDATVTPLRINSLMISKSGSSCGPRLVGKEPVALELAHDLHHRFENAFACHTYTAHEVTACSISILWYLKQITLSISRKAFLLENHICP